MGSELLVSAQHGPDDARILVSYGNDGSVHAASFPDRVDSSAECVGSTLRHADDRSGPVDQQRSEMLVASFADAHQEAFVAAGVLARHKSHPGCHMSSILILFAVSLHDVGS